MMVGGGSIKAMHLDVAQVDAGSSPARHSGYRSACRTSRGFWTGMRVPPRGGVCICGLCDTWCYEYPQHHHMVVPKNRGIRLDVWWNLVPLHDYCHGLAHGGYRELLLSRLCVRLGGWEPGEEPASGALRQGYLWLEEQLEALELVQEHLIPDVEVLIPYLP